MTSPRTGPRTGPSFEYRHEVGFEETSFVGSVYFVHHLRWQGRCREEFLRLRAPGVLAALHAGLALVTTHASCEYLAELQAFDVVTVRMTLAALMQNRLVLRFEYWRHGGEADELVARGEQSIGCMRRDGATLVPCAVPDELVQALRPYAGPQTQVIR